MGCAPSRSRRGLPSECAQSRGDRVVGICDTPITMAKRAARLLGVDPRTPVGLDYVGLNHLGWLRGLRVDGEDLLPRLLADDALLGATEEGQLFGIHAILQAVIGALRIVQFAFLQG